MRYLIVLLKTFPHTVINNHLTNYSHRPIRSLDDSVLWELFIKYTSHSVHIAVSSKPIPRPMDVIVVNTW